MSSQSSDHDLSNLQRIRLEEQLNYKLSSEQWKMATTPTSLSPSPESGRRSRAAFLPQKKTTSAQQHYSQDSATKENQDSGTLQQHLFGRKKDSLVTLDDLDLLNTRANHFDLKWTADRDDSLSSLDNEDDYNYFRTSTRRRRSGTWP